MAKPNDRLKSLFLESVKGFLQEQSELDRAKIAAAIDSMQNGNSELLHVKTLKSPIKELIVRSCRVIFFRYNDTLYFVGGFRKKSAKTPKNEISEAEKIYKIVKNEKQKKSKQ